VGRGEIFLNPHWAVVQKYEPWVTSWMLGNKLNFSAGFYAEKEWQGLRKNMGRQLELSMDKKSQHRVNGSNHN
jgi:hypothetical protein